MGNQPCLKPESRNTFSSLCSLYHLVSRASESRAVKETQQIKDSLFFSPSNPCASRQETHADAGDEFDGRENATVEKEKVRMTQEGML